MVGEVEGWDGEGIRGRSVLVSLRTPYYDAVSLLFRLPFPNVHSQCPPQAAKWHRTHGQAEKGVRAITERKNESSANEKVSAP